MKQGLISRLRMSFRARKDLDPLLEKAPSPEEPLHQRTSWFFDLLEWIYREGIIEQEADFSSGETQAARLRYLLNVLDRNAQWKVELSKTLISLIRDTTALSLLIETGIPTQDSFGAEFLDRIQRKILPSAPLDDDLAYLFNNHFQNEQDVLWIRQIDTQTASRLTQLVVGAEDLWAPLKNDLERAILLLSLQVQGLGLGATIRQRLDEKDFQKLPFYQLVKLVEDFRNQSHENSKQKQLEKIEVCLVECFQSLKDVQKHLDEYGVSIQIVFQIEKIERLLARIHLLLRALQDQHLNMKEIVQFLETLLVESFERNRLMPLVRQSFSLMARKIVERTAETGEHYITRNREEFYDMFQKAIGGGLITALTTVLKFMISGLGFSSFYSGLFASLNYTGSFLSIHFLNFTLATKQSSMTGPALASKMQGLQDPKTFEALIDEMTNLFRSQVVAVVGNILGVIPLVILISLAYQNLSGESFLSRGEALKTLNSFSILGPTPLFALFTGFLLWASSVFAGWMDNWFAYHRLTLAISKSRRIIFVLGESRARWVGVFLKKNFAAIFGTLSLGFSLGLLPVLLQFFGIYLDVRHVTLGTGAFTAAIISLPSELYSGRQVLLAVAGLISMGFFNIVGSFLLAFLLAIRARKIQAPERSLIYNGLVQRIRSDFWSLFWPTKNINKQ